jgi:hypothetical protein
MINGKQKGRDHDIRRFAGGEKDAIQGTLRRRKGLILLCDGSRPQILYLQQTGGEDKKKGIFPAGQLPNLPKRKNIGNCKPNTCNNSGHRFRLMVHRSGN